MRRKPLSPDCVMISLIDHGQHDLFCEFGVAVRLIGDPCPLGGIEDPGQEAVQQQGHVVVVERPEVHGDDVVVTTRGVEQRGRPARCEQPEDRHVFGRPGQVAGQFERASVSGLGVVEHHQQGLLDGCAREHARQGQLEVGATCRRRAVPP